MIFVIPLRYPFQSNPHRFVASTIQAYLVLRFPTLRQVSPRQFTGVLQSIAAGIGTSNFLRAFVMIGLNSSSSGSMKKIPLNRLALSSFGFSIAHFCFAFSSLHQTYASTSGHTLSGPEVVRFLVSLSPDHVCPSGGLSFNQMSLVKPVHASDNSRSPPTYVPVIINIFSNKISSEINVVLVTSMYFSGIGNDSSLSMYSLTLGST